MADENLNPFGISLFGSKPSEKLKLDPRGTSVSQTVDGRAMQINSRPTLLDRGLSLNETFQKKEIANSKFALKEPKLDIKGLPNQLSLPIDKNEVKTQSALSSPRSFLKELESLRIQGIYNNSKPGNVSFEDVRGGDSIFNMNLIKSIKDASDEYKINPGLIGSHLSAEVKDFIYVQKTRGYFWSDELGLDNWVSDKKDIERVKSKNNINEIPDDFFTSPESQTRRGIVTTRNGRVRFPSLDDAVRACAKYIKYKQNIARSENNIGNDEFNNLIPEIKLQLSRLMVNPGDPTYNKNVGIKYWISQVKKGTYENIFDFSGRSYKDSGEDVRRRATIHTARAIHISRDIFGVEP